MSAYPRGQAPDKVTPTAAQVAGQLRVLVASDQIVELRAVRVQRGSGRPHTQAGFFDYAHLEDMARAALDLTRVSRGVYLSLNPLRPDLLARCCCRTSYAEEGTLAKDKDVLARRWLLVDADPVRDPQVSATDAENAAAWETILAVRDYLTGIGWSPPIPADSGNGFHLLYRVDLPAEDGGLVKRCLEALAKQFDNEHVIVDPGVYNPSRICRVPGTWARKGDNVPERPHRMARFLEVPPHE
jgi:hypothetical protein